MTIHRFEPRNRDEFGKLFGMVAGRRGQPSDLYLLEQGPEYIVRDVHKRLLVRGDYNAVREFLLTIPKVRRAPDQIRHRGYVCWFDAAKGYGWLRETGMPDLFCHRNNCLDEDLQEDDEVEYAIIAGRSRSRVLRSFLDN